MLEGYKVQKEAGNVKERKHHGGISNTKTASLDRDAPGLKAVGVWEHFLGKRCYLLTPSVISPVC